MKALGVGIVFSFLGSLFSFFILSFFAPMLADVALKFTPVENFGICFFALTMVAILSSGNMIKGLLAGLFGLVFCFIGMAPIDGTARFTFGNANLLAGFNQLTTLIGIFAVADILKSAEEMNAKGVQTIPTSKVKGFGFSMKEFVSWLPGALRAALIGTGIGILPGIGGSTSQDVVTLERTTLASRLVLEVVAHGAAGMHHLAGTGDAHTLGCCGLCLHLRHCCPPCYFFVSEVSVASATTAFAASASCALASCFAARRAA